MKQRPYTTISIKPELSEELGKLRRDYNTSKAGVIVILINMSKKFVNVRNKESYSKLMQEENMKPEEFFKQIKILNKNFSSLVFNLETKYNLVPIGGKQLNQRCDIKEQK